MAENRHPPGRARGRPRSEATHDAIVDATLQLIDTDHYRDISIERIAAVAKVGKQSIYRWWPSKAELLLHVLSLRFSQRLPPYMPSDDAFDDLRDQLRKLSTVLRRPIVRRTLHALFAEALLDGDFAARLDGEFVALRRNRVIEILQHGQELGQVRADADLAFAAEMMLGVVMPRLADPARAADDRLIGSAVTLLEHALSRRAAKRDSP